MPLRYYSWEKRAIRKNDDTDEDEYRKLAETIAAETLPGRPLEQKELAAWLLAKPSRLRQLPRSGRRSSCGPHGKDSTMTTRETLIAKRDAVGLATHICKNGGGDLSEASYTAIIAEYAALLYPDLSEAQAFTKRSTRETLRASYCGAPMRWWPADCLTTRSAMTRRSASVTTTMATRFPSSMKKPRSFARCGPTYRRSKRSRRSTPIRPIVG